MRALLIYAALGLLHLAFRFEDESELARKLRARDPKAMEVLYDRYGRLVYSLIFRVVNNTGAAEDLTQETFLRVWNRAQALDAERGAIGPWILTIARNRAIDYLRSSGGRLASNSLDLNYLEHPGRFNDFEPGALQMDRSQVVRQAFERLTPNQKTVIELAYFEGLSQAEMAERMQQPLGTVKTWVRGALKALRDQLQEGAAA